MNSDNPYQHFEEVIEFRDSLDPETDRGCALMSASFLDSELEKLLHATFVNDPGLAFELLNHSGPIGTFSSRIDLAYLLGMIGKRAHRDLHLIRKIRNEFGHSSQPLTFEEQTIANRCNELYHITTTSEKPRSKFTNAVLGVTALIHYTLNIAEHISPMFDIDIKDKDRFDFKKLAERLEGVTSIQERAKILKKSVGKN